MSDTPGTLLEKAEGIAARVFAGEAVPVAQREFALAILRRVPVARSNPGEARGTEGAQALRITVAPVDDDDPELLDEINRHHRGT